MSNTKAKLRELIDNFYHNDTTYHEIEYILKNNKIKLTPEDFRLVTRIELFELLFEYASKDPTFDMTKILEISNRPSLGYSEDIVMKEIIMRAMANAVSVPLGINEVSDAIVKLISQRPHASI